MKSLSNLTNQPISVPLVADDILEFHAARLLLLFKLCGKASRIEGLTKMAKLDFFVRYPRFFNVACMNLGFPESTSAHSTESSMIKFHYGPWDDRYYHVLSYLEAKHLMEIVPKGNMYELKLTKMGDAVAESFVKDQEYSVVVNHMKEVKKVLGSKTGSALKKLVYQLFEDEVKKKPLGEVIA